MSKQPDSEHRTKPAHNQTVADFAVMGKKHMEEFAKAQTEILDQVRAVNQQWVARLQNQANLASKMAAQLATAHSVPEAMSIYCEWTSRQLEIMANDGKHLLDDTQKLVGASARPSSGWIANWTGVSS